MNVATKSLRRRAEQIERGTMLAARIAGNVARLAVEHGAPNSFLAQEVAPHGVSPMVVGRVLRSLDGALALRERGLVVAPVDGGGFSVEAVAS